MQGIFRGTWRERCPDGIYLKKTMTLLVRCGSWDCPVCAPRKARKLMRRAHHGQIAIEGKQDGFRDLYNFKLLTLTYGGNEKRKTASPAEAAKEMSKAWDKLVKAMREEFGHFLFLKVFETHKDGWPHLHILLVGKNISPWEVRAYIEKLWRYKYHFGFIKLNSNPDSRTKAISYILKYLFKDPHVIKGVHIYSASRTALERAMPKIKKAWEDSALFSAHNWQHAEKFYDLLRELGKEEVTVGIEILPMKDCPF